jgi:hypothetical protein
MLTKLEAISITAVAAVAARKMDSTTEQAVRVVEQQVLATPLLSLERLIRVVAAEEELMAVMVVTAEAA